MSLQRGFAVIWIALILALVAAAGASTFYLGKPSSTHQITKGVISVRVQVTGRPGMAPAPGVSVPSTRVLGSAVGAKVQVLDPKTRSLVAEQLTDTQGLAKFTLSPGQYWLVVPWGSQIPGYQGGTWVGANLPTGEPVLGWQEVSASSGQSVTRNITIEIAET